MISVITSGLLCCALLLQIVFLIRDSSRPDPVSLFVLPAAALLLLVTIIIRSVTIRFAAITNTYESLLFFSSMICIVLSVYRFVSGKKAVSFLVFGGTFVALVLMALASSPIVPDDIKPPIPALQSSWLVLHVTLSFIGEAFFVFAFVASILFLASRSEEKRQKLDRLTYTSIAIGYPVFTAGALVFGAIWAQHAWGHYWSWDPKETWALITWLTYTLFLHVRFFARRRKRLAAVISVVGFAFTLFTFFGVNYLLPGLHSYL